MKIKLSEGVSGLISVESQFGIEKCVKQNLKSTAAVCNIIFMRNMIFCISCNEFEIPSSFVCRKKNYLVNNTEI